MSCAAATLVVGVGNEWRGDDGAGIAVARALQAAKPGLRVLELGGDPSDLLEALESAEVALIVDSTHSGSEPGTIHRLDPAVDDLADTLPRTSSHALGLADTLELGRTLGRLPPTIFVYGIEGEVFAPGKGLSPRVAKAVARVADAIVADLE